MMCWCQFMHALSPLRLPLSRAQELPCLALHDLSLANAVLQCVHDKQCRRCPSLVLLPAASVFPDPLLGYPQREATLACQAAGSVVQDAAGGRTWRCLHWLLALVCCHTTTVARPCQATDASAHGGSHAEAVGRGTYQCSQHAACQNQMHVCTMPLAHSQLQATMSRLWPRSPRLCTNPAWPMAAAGVPNLSAEASRDRLSRAKKSSTTSLVDARWYWTSPRSKTTWTWTSLLSIASPPGSVGPARERSPWDAASYFPAQVKPTCLHPPKYFCVLPRCFQDPRSRQWPWPGDQPSLYCVPDHGHAPALGCYSHSLDGVAPVAGH